LFENLGFPENNKMLDWINGFPYIYTEEGLSNHLLAYLLNNPDLTIFAIRACPSSLSPPFLSEVRVHTHVLGIMGFRLHPQSRVIKMDDFLFSPLLQRTYAATEAHYLLLRHLFEKQPVAYCRAAATRNALNIQAQQYHERLGYVYEGTLRKDNITRWGTPRDTACSSMLDDEWPANKRAFLKYLMPTNFDADGKQLKSLRELIMQPSIKSLL
jgi:hypothetical protein